MPGTGTETMFRQRRPRVEAPELAHQVEYTLAPDKFTFMTRDQVFIPRSQQDPHNQTCSLCLFDYGTDRDGEEWEYAVRLDIPGCNHVFGDKCLVDMLQRPEPSLSRCPLCRTKWFRTPEDDEVWEEDWEDLVEEPMPRYLANLVKEREYRRSGSSGRSNQLVRRALDNIRRREPTAEFSATASTPIWIPSEEEVREAENRLTMLYDACCAARRDNLREEGRDYTVEEEHRQEAKWSFEENWSRDFGTWKYSAITHTLRDYRNDYLWSYRHGSDVRCAVCIHLAASGSQGNGYMCAYKLHRSFFAALCGRRSVDLVRY